MMRSNKINFNILYLIIALLLAGGAVYCSLKGLPLYAVVCVLAAIFSIYKYHKQYDKLKRNILWMLNALENSDFSLNFTEDGNFGKRNELNRTLNRFRDVFRKTQNEIIQHEQFLGFLFENIPTGMIMFDEREHVRLVNQSALKQLGLPILTHISQLNLINPQLPKLFKEGKSGMPKNLQITNEREELEINIRFATIKFKEETLKIATLINIEDELGLKETESWTRLIRVITHEIMNSIAPITSISETMIMLLNDDTENNNEELKEQSKEAMETINETSKGLISFVESYRKFTGIPKPQPILFDLNTMIEQIISLQRKIISEKGIDIRYNFLAKDTLIEADRSQIQQVFVNLIKNAIEGINPDEGKLIRINVGMSKATDKLKIEVQNSGSPIPNDVLPNIFIPFFTTKESGSGIGLSISRHIMRLHGGNLKYSYKDRMNTFTISF